MSKRPPQPVPSGYHNVTPWIIADNSSDLVSFIEKVFDGKETEGSRMIGSDGLIDHVEVRVGDSVLMLFDRRQYWPKTPSFLRIYVKDAEEVTARARWAGATVIIELTPLFWGDRIGRIRDRWGNLWWVQERVEELDLPEQMERMGGPDAKKQMKYVKESLNEAMKDTG